MSTSKEQARSQVRQKSEAAQHDASSVPGLVRQLADEVSSLFSKEVALAKVEVAESVSEAKKGAGSMITGGAVLYAGLIFLLLAAVVGLAQVVEFWLSSLIIGGVVAIIGLIMVQAGKKKIQPSSLKPEHTLNTLQKDQQAVRGESKYEH
ncbi:MAG TPA: phage holin family protein [Gammaproteobacteria bacterium]